MISNLFLGFYLGDVILHGHQKEKEIVHEVFLYLKDIYFPN